MNKQTRINQMVEILKAKNGASVKELSEHLEVTEMTIRRDIKQLSESGIVKIISGAVILNAEISKENSEDFYDLSVQRGTHISEKYHIGKLAASLIMPNDTVFFDIGTTASAIIPHIPANIDITAVCCTLNALMEIDTKGIQNIILLGGRYLSDVQMFESREGVELLNRTRISKAFISAAGVNAKLGVTCVNSYEVDTKCAAIRNALKRILVVDSTKFGQVKPAFFAPITQFDAIITDSGISLEWEKEIKRLGIKLYVA